MKDNNWLFGFLTVILDLCLIFFITRYKREVDSGIVTKTWIQFPYESKHLQWSGGYPMPVFMRIHTTQHLLAYCISIQGKNKRGKIHTQTFYLNKLQWDTIVVGMQLNTKGLNYIEPTK